MKTYTIICIFCCFFISCQKDIGYEKRLNFLSNELRKADPIYDYDFDRTLFWFNENSDLAEFGIMGLHKIDSVYNISINRLNTLNNKKWSSKTSTELIKIFDENFEANKRVFEEMMQYDSLIEYCCVMQGHWFNKIQDEIKLSGEEADLINRITLMSLLEKQCFIDYIKLRFKKIKSKCKNIIAISTPKRLIYQSYNLNVSRSFALLNSNDEIPLLFYKKEFPGLIKIDEGTKGLEKNMEIIPSYKIKTERVGLQNLDIKGSFTYPNSKKVEKFTYKINYYVTEKK